MKAPTPHDRAATSPLTAFSVASIGVVALLLLPAPARAAGPVDAARLAAVAPVTGKAKPTKVFPFRTTLTDDKVARWAVVLRKAPAHRLPRASSSVVTTLSTVTSDETQNLVLILSSIELDAKRTWYRVRLPILPNNSTGWVPRSALGNLYTVRTHLYVDRKTFTATLKRDGRTIFTSRVGIGRSYWPTPGGQFYVRNKLTSLDNPIYGPLAFGTSARSPVLTDWPGGGFIGIHGTNEPHLLPGAVSHGCIRMRNDTITRLSLLMPVGTPLTIT
jgi:hypothetical protein